MPSWRSRCLAAILGASLLACEPTEAPNSAAEAAPGPEVPAELELAQQAMRDELRPVFEALAEPERVPFLMLTDRGRDLYLTAPESLRALVVRAASASGYDAWVAWQRVVDIEPALALEGAAIRRHAEADITFSAQPTGRHISKRIQRSTGLTVDSGSPPTFYTAKFDAVLRFSFSPELEQFQFDGNLDAATRQLALDCDERTLITVQNQAVHFDTEEQDSFPRQFRTLQTLPAADDFIRSLCAGDPRVPTSLQQWLLMFSRSGDVQAWLRGADGTLPEQPQFSLAVGVPLEAIALSEDNRTLATHQPGKVRLWEMSPNSDGVEQVREVQAQGALFSRGLFVTSERAIIGLEDNAISVWSPTSNDPILISTPAILDATRSEDGRWLATGHRDGFARLWALDPTDGYPVQVATLEARRALQTVRFSANNRWLLAVTRSSVAPREEDEIHAWELR